MKTLMSHRSCNRRRCCWTRGVRTARGGQSPDARRVLQPPQPIRYGFVPTAKPDRDCTIVTRNSPLISAVSRKRPGKYLIWGGSFIGGGGCREVTVDEAAEYLARRPLLVHLMQLTLEMEWHDAPGEIIEQLLPLHSPVISPSLS